MNKMICRLLQVLVLVFAALGHVVLNSAPPDWSLLVSSLAAMLLLCALLITASASPPMHRNRERWVGAAIILAVLGVTAGLWYRSELAAAIFVYDGDGLIHISGSEFTPEALKLIREDPTYANPNALLLAAAGDHERVWTTASIAQVRLHLSALYLVFTLSIAASVFSAAELLRSPTLPHSRRVILFVAANPSNTLRLDLDLECAAIERELAMTAGRDQLELRSKWAVGIDELMRHLNDTRPAVIHFSGHGESGSRACRHSNRFPAPVTQRDIAIHTELTSGSLVLRSEQDEGQQVDGRALAKIIQHASPRTVLVVLSACFSETMAEALLPTVRCVVGMRGPISDEAARIFAVAFYRALGSHLSVGTAMGQAVAALAARNFPDEHLPVCKVREGIDPNTLVLVSVK